VSRLSRLWRDWVPATPREASDAVVRNLWLHAFPAHATRRALSWGASGWLGTACAALFGVTAVTGGVLLFLYVPSVERAYASVKDVEHVVAFGAWLRGTHRAAAHLMVLGVVLHLIRVFLTGAYKKEGAPGANRPLNWIVGLALLLCTLGLSFTGYLLPWDQLAYWAVQVGTSIAGSVPLVGKAIREALLGGTTIGQSTLLRFYVLHCFVLPSLTTFLVAWHMWRIRKDGGLAVTDRVVDDAVARARAEPPPPGRTYAILGATRGGTVASVAPSALVVRESVASVPNALRRAVAVALASLLLASAIGLLFPAPLEQPADPSRTPNPAKAPWYFLWLQELVSDLTFRVGSFVVDGTLVGGILVPGVLLGLLAAWPWLDRSPREAAGVWFHPSRRRQNAVFLALLVVVAGLTVVGSLCRGPYWAWTWPWEHVPHAPTRI
jgi:quinol-cytochrome oxidoreductase complex cytochrome b subunit